MMYQSAVELLQRTHELAQAGTVGRHGRVLGTLLGRGGVNGRFCSVDTVLRRAYLCLRVR
jgi:hypothetical protein